MTQTTSPEQTLQIAYSPCPNDTFVFDAGPTAASLGAPALDVTFADIDATNGMAERGEFDVLKVSYAVLPYVLDEYTLLPCGRAGPGLLGPHPGAGRGPDRAHGRRAERAVDRLPALPSLGRGHRSRRGRRDRRHALPRDHAGGTGREGRRRTRAIHEARFTYQNYGLHNLADMGEHWSARPGLPIPLGAIIAKRALGEERLKGLADAARASVRAAWDDPQASRPYVLEHAQEMDLAVADQHIGLYVNEFTADLGEDGYAAIRGLLTRATAEGLVPALGPHALSFP